MSNSPLKYLLTILGAIIFCTVSAHDTYALNCDDIIECNSNRDCSSGQRCQQETIMADTACSEEPYTIARNKCVADTPPPVNPPATATPKPIATAPVPTATPARQITPTPGGGSSNTTPTPSCPVLTKPTNLVATCDQSGNTILKWDPVPGAQFYSVRVENAKTAQDWGTSCPHGDIESIGTTFCREEVRENTITIRTSTIDDFNWWVHARCGDVATWDNGNSPGQYGNPISCRRPDKPIISTQQPMCSDDGWSANFAWQKPPNDPRVDSFILRIDLANDWLMSTANKFLHWYMMDGSDHMLWTKNVENQTSSVIPFRTYQGWSVQSLISSDPATNVTNPDSAQAGGQFVCMPKYRAPSGDTAACTDSTGLTIGCTVENFISEYRLQYGYDPTKAQAERANPYPNLVTNANAYGIYAEEGYFIEMIDLLDFEALRYKKHQSLDDKPIPTNTQTPVQVQGITSRYNNTCANLTEGKARCWGPALAIQTSVSQTTPTTIAGLPPNIDTLGVGDAHACALTDDGSIYCWGDNTNGELGNETFINPNTISPTRVKSAPGEGNFVNLAHEIAVGAKHSCMIHGDLRDVWCWGSNEFGQLGTDPGQFLKWHTPRQVVVENDQMLTNVKSITAGAIHTCAITSDDGVVCWGDNTNRQLGTAVTTNNHRALPVAGLAGKVTQVTAGVHHTCALIEDGRVQCWGSNSDYQLGSSATNTSVVPVAITELSSNQVKSIQASAYHTCALLNDKTVKCWGSNEFKQIKNSSERSISLPTAIEGLSNVTALSGGYDNACAVIDSGPNVTCWGRNDESQLGRSTDLPYGSVTLNLTP